MKLTAFQENSYELEFHALRTGAKLELTFNWINPLPSYSAPHTKLGERTIGLWEKTCFEFFFQGQGLKNYFEINMSTDGNWNSFEFSSYRSSPLNEAKDLVCHSFEMGETFLKATFTLPLKLASSPLVANACAVVSDFKEREKFWALSHSKNGAPDFHDLKEFIYKLD